MNINNEISKNHTKWTGWSCKRWNGKGEDVLSDSLLILWEKIIKKEVRFDSPQAMSAWVYRTIQNKGKDTNQDRKKINQNSTSLEANVDKGLQLKKEENEKTEINWQAVWETPIRAKNTVNKGKRKAEELPLFEKIAA